MTALKVQSRLFDRLPDGMLVINKPTGMVSRDIIRWLEKRQVVKQKTGHVGTLDPIAEGVLPILIGRGTKLQDYLVNLEKSYLFDVKFGVKTDTLDSDGNVVGHGPVDHLTGEAIEKVVASMIGRLTQVPPLYSAVKYKGVPLYRYARSGRSLEVPRESLAKTVEIKKFKMLDFRCDVASFSVLCSKGTYVRSLAESISEKLGTCGMVIKLVRAATAGVTLTDSWTLNELEAEPEKLSSRVIPLERLHFSIPVWQVSSDAVIGKLRLGQQVKVNMESFAQGFSELDNQRGLRSSGGMLVLADTNGRSFGIGAAVYHGVDQVQVSMKRRFS